MPIVLLILIAIGAAGCVAQKLPEVQRPRPTVAGVSRPVQGRASSALFVKPKAPMVPMEPKAQPLASDPLDTDDCPGGVCHTPPGK